MAMDITKGATRVYIDPKRCIANAKCTTAAPGVYVLDEETGVAVIENPDDATVEQLFAGARLPDAGDHRRAVWPARLPDYSHPHVWCGQGG